MRSGHHSSEAREGQVLVDHAHCRAGLGWFTMGITHWALDAPGRAVSISCTGCVLPKTTSLGRKRGAKSQHSLGLPKSCTHPGEGMAPLMCRTAPGTWCELSLLILSTTLKGRCGPLRALTETPVASPWRSPVPGEGPCSGCRIEGRKVSPSAPPPQFLI